MNSCSNPVLNPIDYEDGFYNLYLAKYITLKH